MKLNSRNISLDFLKILLSIFVVFQHTYFLKDYNECFNYININGILRIAVPIFFIINGYFFQTIIENKKIKSWVVRVLKLYFIWMIIYSPFWFKPNLKSIVSELLFGYHHLWYIKAMLFSGLFLYVLKKIKLNDRKILIIGIFLFLIGVLIQYIGNYHIISHNSNLDKLTNSINSHRNFLFLGSPFVIIGYLLSKGRIKINSRQLVSLMILGVFLVLVESLLNYYYAPESLDNILSLFLLCPLIFLYTINKNYSSRDYPKTIALISTSIYLIHPLIINLINHLFKFDSLFIAISTLSCSFFFSLIMIRINNHIKIL